MFNHGGIFNRQSKFKRQTNMWLIFFGRGAHFIAKIPTYAMLARSFWSLSMSSKIWLESRLFCAFRILLPFRNTHYVKSDVIHKVHNFNLSHRRQRKVESGQWAICRKNSEIYSEIQSCAFRVMQADIHTHKQTDRHRTRQSLEYYVPLR